jgi:hypothetical protein
MSLDHAHDLQVLNLKPVRCQQITACVGSMDYSFLCFTVDFSEHFLETLVQECTCLDAYRYWIFCFFVSYNKKVNCEWRVTMQVILLIRWTQVRRAQLTLIVIVAVRLHVSTSCKGHLQALYKWVLNAKHAGIPSCYSVELHRIQKMHKLYLLFIIPLRRFCLLENRTGW